MDELINNEYSQKLIKVVIKDKYCPTINIEKSNKEKSVFDFLSNKKIKLESYFDKKGTKKFLSDKEKAMEEIVLFDEIIDEKKNRNEDHHHHHNKSKSKKKNYFIQNQKKKYIKSKQVNLIKRKVNLIN